MAKKYISSALERAVMTYMHPRYFKFFIAESFINGDGKSERGNIIFKKHYDSKSKDELRALEKAFDEMTDDQIKRPNKFNGYG